VIGEPALPCVAGLGLEPVDEIDHVVEATTCADPSATWARSWARRRWLECSLSFLSCL
jgi:hypothetical protein